MKDKQDIVVFITRSDPSCSECGEELGRSAWITLDSNKNAVCLECADLDHLVFLPSGDTALTRRSKKHSRLFAVVVRWARARKRYERQGLLVESEALERAEEECAADEAARQRARKKAAARRAELDREYIQKFARRIRELYPFRPEGRERLIAEHACRKYTGRVGRSAAAKSLDPHAVRLAVTAHVRHAETPYDEMLLEGIDRREAREHVARQVARVLESWESGGCLAVKVILSVPPIGSQHDHDRNHPYDPHPGLLRQPAHRGLEATGGLQDLTTAVRQSLPEALPFVGPPQTE